MAATAKPFPGVRFITREEAAARQAARAGASPATTEALEELAYWSQRTSFLTHLAAEAQQRLAEARSEAKALGITKEQARTWRPPAASTGARRGGFAFFYAESGLDLDGNGLVDGGLSNPSATSSEPARSTAKAS
jgi:hypothetical protein